MPPCGPGGGRFIEVEDETGKSIRFGEWVDRGDGTHALRIKLARMELVHEAAE